MGVGTPDAAERERVGEAGRFHSCSHRLLLTPSSRGKNPGPTSQIPIGVMISSRLHKQPTRDHPAQFTDEDTEA